MLFNKDEYFDKVKQRVKDDDYPYTVEVLEANREYFDECYENELSPYKAIEFFYFHSIAAPNKL